MSFLDQLYPHPEPAGHSAHRVKRGSASTTTEHPHATLSRGRYAEGLTKPHRRGALPSAGAFGFRPGSVEPQSVHLIQRVRGP
ncbi:hypothetical protein ABH930_006460 [Kitasatospora sp. GAS204A]|nr:hypothetical protein [Kitasatospora sp. GAS204B]